MTLEFEKKRLARLMEQLVTKEGLMDSALENVKLFRANRDIKRGPLVYEPGILIIARGQKIGYLGGEIYHYNSDNYLVVATPLPMECETTASPDEPVLGMGIRLDPVMISELLIEMDSVVSLPGSVSRPMPRALYSARHTKASLDAVIRLVAHLGDPVDGPILGPQAVREIVYRILTGEHGEVLRLLAVRHGRFNQMAKVLLRIHTDFNRKLNIETLADEANMSVSSFHSNFKAVTSTSPIQYIKGIRLQKARLMMVQDDLNALEAAARVGYESASQFNREFKRYFGNTPVDEAERMRSMG